VPAVKRLLRWIAACGAGLLLGASGAAWAAGQPGLDSGPRVALVIGNAGYRTMPLTNPLNDARAVAEALGKLGFKVINVQNASHKQMFDAVRQFGDALHGGVGLFYYAGHGVQVKGRNFLIPVDAAIEREDEVPYKAFDVGLVLEKMEAARNPLNIVILDACRNNPFSGAEIVGPDGRRLKFRGATPSGLARVEAPLGSMVAFSTAPGGVALDNPNERNSLYTKHLLAHINAPGLPVELLFKNVRLGVARDTGRVQVPWESSSLTGDFCFRQAPGGGCGAVR